MTPEGRAKKMRDQMSNGGVFTLKWIEEELTAAIIESLGCTSPRQRAKKIWDAMGPGDCPTVTHMEESIRDACAEVQAIIGNVDPDGA